ncbi:hypothetical protein GmHk_04G010113 [Glycine max]|nr:hypothetical protein GmHk_04G010113 [Glycine max]
MNQKSTPVARLCGLCSSTDYHTDLCPSLQQSGVNEKPEAYAANIYNRPPQQQNQQQQNNYDLSRNRYNPGWRNHPNLRWTSPLQQQQLAPPQPSLEELVRQMTIQNMQFQQETRAFIQSLINQMGQMATQLNQAQSQNSDKLSSQTMQNLKNVSDITLRSGNQNQVPPPVAAPTPEPDEIVAQKRKLPNKNFHVVGRSSKSNSKQKDGINGKGDLGDLQESRGEHTSARCYQADSKICQVSKGVVHPQKEAQGQ